MEEVTKHVQGLTEKAQQAAKIKKLNLCSLNQSLVFYHSPVHCFLGLFHRTPSASY
jgi:hypothetical protein